jgi:hypothetical protein
VAGARPNHQADRGSDPNHRGIWSPPRAGLEYNLALDPGRRCLYQLNPVRLLQQKRLRKHMVSHKARPRCPREQWRPLSRLVLQVWTQPDQTAFLIPNSLPPQPTTSKSQCAHGMAGGPRLPSLCIRQIRVMLRWRWENGPRSISGEMQNGPRSISAEIAEIVGQVQEAGTFPMRTRSDMITPHRARSKHERDAAHNQRRAR